MNNVKKKTLGFGIIEILIVLLIVSIIAIALLPSFQVYTKKAKFKDVITAADNTKSSVNTCIVSTGSTNNCNAGTNQVIPDQTFPSGAYVSSVSVTSGTITGTGSTDVDNATYILTPTLNSNNVVTWSLTGTCLTYGYCDGSGGTGSGGSGGGGSSGPSYTSLQQQTVTNCSTPSTPGFYCSSGSGSFPCACGGGGIGPDSSLATTLAQCQTTANNVGNDPATCVLMP